MKKDCPGNPWHAIQGSHLPFQPESFVRRRILVSAIIEGQFQVIRPYAHAQSQQVAREAEVIRN